MAITDKLRKWAEDEMPLSYRMAVLAIADRIDEAAQDMSNKAYCDGQSASIRAKVSDELAKDNGWVRLPTDADGVPIRFKDKVTVPWSDKVYEVSGFSYQEHTHLGTMTVWINTHEDGEVKALCATGSCHHYKPPTTEDVLNEMLDVYCSNDSRTPCQLVAEYAKRLQLREDA